MGAFLRRLMFIPLGLGRRHKSTDWAERLHSQRATRVVGESSQARRHDGSSGKRELDDFWSTRSWDRDRRGMIGRSADSL
jgi:hypothetical protein